MRLLNNLFVWEAGLRDLKLYSGMGKLLLFVTFLLRVLRLPVLPAQKHVSCYWNPLYKHLKTESYLNGLSWHMGLMGRAQFSSDGVILNCPFCFLLHCFSHPCFSGVRHGLAPSKDTCRWPVDVGTTFCWVVVDSALRLECPFIILDCS